MNVQAGQSSPFSYNKTYRNPMRRKAAEDWKKRYGHASARRKKHARRTKSAYKH